MNENKMPTGPAQPLVAQRAGCQNLDLAEAKLMELFRGMVQHNGLSQLRVEVKILKKGRKDVVLSTEKDFHFVLKPAFVKTTAGGPVQDPVGKGNPGD